MQHTFEKSRLGDVLKELSIEGFKYFNVEKFYEPMNKSYIIPRVSLFFNNFNAKKKRFKVPRKYTYAYLYSSYVPDDDRPVLNKKVWKVHYLTYKETSNKEYKDLHNPKTWEAKKCS